MSKKILIFIIFILVFGVFFFGRNYYSNLLASLTYRRNIEDVGDEGFGNSLVLNSKGEPMIAYATEENKLVFKKKVDNNWQEEIVSNNAFPGNKISLAVNSSGEVYILYIAKDASLNLAHKKEGGWYSEKIFDSAALSCNLVFDENDVLHISFWSPQKGLAYGVLEKNNWKIDIVDYGQVGWWNSLAIDKKQNPHISYFDFKNKNLLYLFFDGKRWQKEVVDKEGEVGSWNSIVVDSDGNPKISYFDETSGNLKFAQKTIGGWLIEKVDKDGIVGERTNIILDKSQKPIICYDGLSDNTFRIAKKTDNGWDIVIVDREDRATNRQIKGEEGGDNSLTIDNNGKDRKSVV